jgi:hypothetical protein
VTAVSASVGSGVLASLVVVCDVTGAPGTVDVAEEDWSVVVVLVPGSTVVVADVVLAPVQVAP